MDSKREHTHHNLTMLTDFYELTMSNGYLANGKGNTVVYFDMFYRKKPDNGGFAIMAGLEQLIDYMKEITFTEEDIEYFRTLNIFDENFLEYLRNFPSGKAIQKLCQKVQIGDLQDAVIRDLFQAFRRQYDHLADVRVIHASHALQTDLHQFLIGVIVFGDPVHVFVIKKLLYTGRLVFQVFDDGKGHVRLQSHQLSVGIGKGNDAVRDQKVLILHIQVILLKFAHLILGIAIAAVKFPEGKNHPLLKT